MREIKFRAWDQLKNKWWCGEDFISWQKPSNWKAIFVIEQFTGLLDKNGREIYEGDIVKETYLEDPGLIQYIRAGYFFNDYKGPYLPLADARLSYEVIGNIHENPELIS